MDIFKLIEDKPILEDYLGLNTGINKLTSLGIDIYDNNKNLLVHFLDPENPGNKQKELDEFVTPLYKFMGEGLLIFHNLFTNASIDEGNIDEYLNHIISEQGLSDSEYYTNDNYMGKLCKLIKYSMLIGGDTNTRGYVVNSSYSDTIRISQHIIDRCSNPTLELFIYLNKSLTIFKDDGIENKTQAQGFLLEAFMMWLKVSLILNLSLKTSIEEAYANN